MSCHKRTYAARKFCDRDVAAAGDEQNGASDDDEPTAADVIPVDSVRACVLDEAGFWLPLVEILRVTTPLVVLLRMFDGDKPVMGKVYDKMFMVGEQLKKSKAPWIDRVAEIHSDRWEYLHSEFHAAAYALDPEFLSTAGEHDAPTQAGLLAVIERVCMRDVIASQADPAEAMKVFTIDSPEVQELVEKAQYQLMQYQAKEEVLSKASVQNNAKTAPPASWWNTFGRNMPELCSIAKRVLAQPAAASVAERNWSVYGQVKSSERSRLRHFSADRRVFCHESLHLQQKLQNAKYKQEVQPWDVADSDSQESEGEEDVMKYAR